MAMHWAVITQKFVNQSFFFLDLTACTAAEKQTIDNTDHKCKCTSTPGTTLDAITNLCKCSDNNKGLNDDKSECIGNTF